MPVFKLCMKVFKKNIPIMMIYFGVFIGVSFLMTNMMGPKPAEGFKQTMTRVAWLAEEDTPLLQGLKDELSKIAVYVTIENREESLQDALYFRKVDYVLRIPAGFTESFMAGSDAPLKAPSEVKLDKTAIPGSSDVVYLDRRINHYLNTARTYVENVKGATQEEIVGHVKENLALETNLALLTQTQAEKTRGGLLAYSFNYLAYTTMFVLILGVSTIMLILNQTDIKRRNGISPLGAASINFQLITATLLFALISWLILVGFCLLFSWDHIAKVNTLYHIANSFIFTLSIASISYLIGSLVKGREAISAIANVFALGSSFMCGVFVPQFILGKGVLKVASFLPAYWYVRANDRISQLTEFSFDSTRDILGFMSIEVGFAVAFLVLALVIGKRKQLEM